MNATLADLVWDILVEYCGASDRPFDREMFIRSQLKQKPPSEFRFCGRLGFGGKFWQNMGQLYVTCYPEDETKERKQMIEAANRALANLLQTV